MAPARPNQWDDEDDSTPPSSPPATIPVGRRTKFDDEEENGDVAESWDAEDDSEEEAEKAKQAATRKAKADAEAAAAKKSRLERVAQHQAARKAAKEAEDDEDDETSSEEEDETERKKRLAKTEKDADLDHAADLFGEIGISNKRSAAPKTVIITKDAKDDTEKALDLATLPIFKAKTKEEFEKMNQVLAPLISGNSRNPQYALSFLPEFFKSLSKDLNSGDIKKLSTTLGLLSNEKMREEKAAEKGGKKSKAAKTKTSLVAGRDTVNKADLTAYDDDGLDE
ncbi:MAG: hypothetical protein M1823_004539 [Watsoniomyces obsoletus]|nr:MAG: hypothetical protein M1823_004539 [Watsoniomyces obsoletus]